MKLYDYIPKSVLEKAIADGYVEQKNSSCGNFFLLDYTREATFDGIWSDATLKTRGLVVDSNNLSIVGMCIPKFHNLTEGAPHHLRKYADCIESGMSYEVYEKVDGSFGNVWWNKYTNRWQCSTRGSFESDQAKWANEWLDKKLAHERNLIDIGSIAVDHRGDRTNFIFEIIYPDNRVVVDYGDMQELVLLTGYVIGQDHVEELNQEEISYVCKNNEFVMVSSFNMTLDQVSEKCKTLDSNHEGYVVRFADGFRVKVKGDAYISLHKLISGLSTTSVWENIDYNTFIISKDWLVNVPEEFRDAIELCGNNMISVMQTEYNTIHTLLGDVISDCILEYGSNFSTKELVSIIRTEKYIAHFHDIIAVHRGHDAKLREYIWKRHRPVFSKSL